MAEAKAWDDWLPGLQTLRRYQLAWLRHDVLAGLVLATFLVPVGIAYASASGVPPIYGLYATIAGMLAYAVFGPSRILVNGPDSALAALNDLARETGVPVTAIGRIEDGDDIWVESPIGRQKGQAILRAGVRPDVVVGQSIGDKYGPVLISKQPLTKDDLAGKPIAVPGQLTTAHLAFKLWYPEAITEVVPFDQIMDKVNSGEYLAGVIIHEGQLTYADEGFHKVVDLGEWWFETVNLTLPLGSNAIRKDLGPELIQKIGRCLKRSIEYGLANREAALDYAMQFARGLDRQKADVEAFRRDENLKLPDDLDYSSVPGLSNEARQRLAQVRPATLGQASRIDGMTPAAIGLLLGYVRGGRLARAG